jgi:hypothetical protein
MLGISGAACIDSAMAFFSPRLAVLVLPVLTLVGCTAVGPGNDAEVTAEDQKRSDQCERMERLLGDRTLTPQQIEAVRARMNTNGCLAP